MNATRNRDPFEGLRPPRVPPVLERRVLDAAAAAAEGAPPPTTWDRMWSSRRLRMAWVCSTVALLLAHAGVTVVSRSSKPIRDPRSVERQHVRETREAVALPVVDISPRAAALALGAGPRTSRTRTSAGPTPADRS